jgi:hypothetical protein
VIVGDHEARLRSTRSRRRATARQTRRRGRCKQPPYAQLPLPRTLSFAVVLPLVRPGTEALSVRYPGVSAIPGVVPGVNGFVPPALHPAPPEGSTRDPHHTNRRWSPKEKRSTSHHNRTGRRRIPGTTCRLGRTPRLEPGSAPHYARSRLPLSYPFPHRKCPMLGSFVTIAATHHTCCSARCQNGLMGINGALNGVQSNLKFSFGVEVTRSFSRWRSRGMVG